MFKIFVSLLTVVSIFSMSDYSEAGVLSRRNCRRVAVVNVAAVANVVDVQFTPTFVSFVPSQVLLNSQITTYGVQSAGVGYSYQGGYQSAGTQQAVQPQAAATGGGSAVEQRLERLEKLLLKLAGEDVSISATGVDNGWKGIITKSCKGCHSPGGKGYDKLAIYDASGIIKAKLPKYKIYTSITDGSMPKGGPVIDDEATLTTLRDWVHRGLDKVEY